VREGKSRPKVLPKHIRQLLVLLDPDWTSDPWARVPMRARRRYERLAKENAVQLKRHLDEYRRLFATDKNNLKIITESDEGRETPGPQVG
jgi:hypothetical protein